METGALAKLVRDAAMKLYDFCNYPAAQYKILFHFLDTPYDDEKLTALRPAFHNSDIVEELHQEQDYNGGWGRLDHKDYDAKDKFPCSLVAIRRCLYIGLTIEDRDILLMAYEYLESFLKGTSKEKLYNKNERAIPWQKATICEAIESIQPHNPLCDNTYADWLYIVSRAYGGGEYSYEKDKAAQHEVFLTREQRLVPMQFGLLLKRRDKLPPELECALLRHHGQHAYDNGHFWDKNLHSFPENFKNPQTRRWFHTLEYINQFHGSAVFLEKAVDWLVENQGTDGLWNYGGQTNDPWGYYEYFSTGKKDNFNRIVNCTVKVLGFLKAYLNHNEGASDV